MLAQTSPVAGVCPGSLTGMCATGAEMGAPPRKRSSVRFVEDSPVLTPSWRSAAWNRKPAQPPRSSGAEVDRSPELRGGSGAAAPVEGDPEWEGAEAQAERDWSGLPCKDSLCWAQR